MAEDLGGENEEENLIGEEEAGVSPMEFVTSTVSRFEEFESKKKERLENLRNERLQEQLSVLQDRPNVNPRSTKVQSELPLHQRFQAELRKRDDHLRQLQKTLETERKRKEDHECTFAPKVIKSKQHSTVSFVTRSQAWLEKKKQANAKKQEMLAMEETANCTLKPRINPVSVRLAEKAPRFRERCCHTPEISSFRPDLSPVSRRMVEDRKNGGGDRPLPIPGYSKRSEKSREAPITEISFSEALQFVVSKGLLRT